MTNNALRTRIQDTTWWLGIVLIVISLLVFCTPLLSHAAANYFDLFIFNYALTVIYFIVLWAKGRLKEGRDGLHPLFLFLILFLISAYALNRELTVFEDSVTWFAVLLVVLCVNYIAFNFFEFMPRPIKHLMCVLLGIGLIVFGYLTFYLLPTCLIGLIGFFFFGISLHAFVPLLLFIYTIKLIIRTASRENGLGYSFVGGAGVVFAFTVVFVVQWSRITNDMNKRYRKADVVQTDDLPAWIKVAQHVSTGWITERALKAELVYSTFSNGRDDLFWRMPARNFGEKSVHDPLVMIASFLAGKPSLDEADRIKVLESIYDSRHDAQRRLWSGKELYTEHINTAVRIWPQFGLSYTEKTVMVSSASSWNDREEGIYTFHLPEGGVVTALSLWIDGKEEKGFLTTQEKADSAYATIVGVQQRDPSVVHWQEGNTVTVRVFPIPANKSRMFKLGITAPLLKQDNKLVYGNIWFDGPSYLTATEDIQLDFAQAPQRLVMPAVFNVEKEQTYKSSGRYKPDWKIALEEQPLSTQAFCFDGKSYTVRPYVPKRIPVELATVYLDINKAWSMAEFEMVYDLVKDKQVFVYQDGLVRLTKDNKEKLFDQLQHLQFSLFPLFEIKDTTHSLLISKSPSVSPNLSDLKDTRHMKQLQEFLATQPALRLYNIESPLSPYLKSLKEYRVFSSYEQGSLEQLKELLVKKTFAASTESDEQVVIDDAGLALMQTRCTGSGGAPDHLLRLFAYNHIMQKTGSRLLMDQPVEDEAVQEAAKAYVVSPVSSLVVLETKKDYENFGITDSKNSLKNASLHSKGAVPEPHEWALIIIAVLVILTIRFKPTLLNRNKA